MPKADIVISTFDVVLQITL